MRALTLLFLLLALTSGMAAAAERGCPAALGAGAVRAESEHYMVVYRTVPERVEINRSFAVEAQVCTKGQAAQPTGLRVDANMPAHRHGMNYRPSVVAEGAGRFRAEGLLFHMPGRWQFVFDVDAPGTHERIVKDYELE